MQHFVTTLDRRKNRSIDKPPGDCKKKDFLTILFNKPFMQNTKPKIKVGDKVRNSKDEIAKKKDFSSILYNEPCKILNQNPELAIK